MDRVAAAATRRGEALAAFVALLVFLPSLRDGYVYDDLLLVSENPFVHRLAYLGRGFSTHFWDVGSDGLAGNVLHYYRPVTTASYVLSWALAAGAPWSLHLGNVLLHAATTYLVVRVASRWTEDRTLGFVAGLVFALHPSRTESVIWVSGRTDVLMAFFALATVELAHAAANAPTAGAKARWMAGAFFAFVAAVMSKETGVFSAALVAVDALASEPGTAPRKTATKTAFGLGAFGLLYAIARVFIFPPDPHGRLSSTLWYGLVTTRAYVERVLFPWPQTFFYRPLEMGSSGPVLPLSGVVLGAIAVLLTVVAGVYALRRDRAAFALFATAAAMIAPVSNFVHTGIPFTTADRFLYLPLFAVIAGALRLGRQKFRTLLQSRRAAIALAAACLVFAGVDVARASDYVTGTAFWQHEVQVNPDNPLALTNLSDEAARRGDLELAVALVRRALSPESSRLFLVAGDRLERCARRARLPSLEAALAPDGDVRTLDRTFSELDRLLVQAASGERGTPADKSELASAIKNNAAIAVIAAETALVGTRIGRVPRANRLSRAVPSALLFRLPNPLNLVLVRARLGDFDGARRLLALLGDPPPGTPPPAAPEQLRDLGERLGRAERAFLDAARSPERRARVEAATALGELGAYLAALRVLRPAFDSAPSETGPLYVELLVSARLDREALDTARHLLGPDRAPSVIAEMRRALSPRIAKLPPAPEPSPWWPG